MEHKLYFGTAYAEPDFPANRVEEDLTWIQNAGFNLICYGENLWQQSETSEGIYDFSVLHRVLSSAQSRNLQVILVLSGNRLPEWLTGRNDSDACSRRFLKKIMEQCAGYSCIIGFSLGDHFHSSEQIVKRAEFIRKYAKTDQFVTGGIYLDMKTIHCTQIDPFAAVSQIDMVGCSVFHSVGGANSGAEISMCADLARGIKGDNYFVLKMQSQGRAGQLPYPGQLRLTAYHHLSGGADCICYEAFHSDPYSDQKGIISHDLRQGRAYRECTRLGEELNRIGERIVGARKCSRVAIMASWRSMEKAVWPKGSDKDYSDYLKWVYESFYRLNIEVDIIPDTQRDFSGYELLVTPCLYSAEDNLIWAIRDFVAGGGKLISTFRSFFADENGRIRNDVQPYGMTDVFGMTYDEYTVPQCTELPEYAADVAEWMELLSLSGARCLGAYGGMEWQDIPAVTCHHFGRGEAAYIGCYSQEGLEPILLRLLAAWHIPVPEISWPVVVKRATSQNGKHLVYLLHYSGSARMIPSPAAGVELLSGQELDEGAPLELRPWDVKILEGNV